MALPSASQDTHTGPDSQHHTAEREREKEREREREEIRDKDKGLLTLENIFFLV